ncbi:hypothetical protein [Streptomyces sp. NPDC058092]|uniref:hypothetical protein n=1 Tax=Streptomyces sp. NPDC058092 TaxID=3346336 RepID=UPI0036EAEE2B
MAAADPEVVVHAGPVRHARAAVRPRRGHGHRGVRPRQRQQPTRPTQPLRLDLAEQGRPGHAAVRPSHGAGRTGPDRAHVFDAALPVRRLGDATRRLLDQPETEGLAVGYYGASTGAAAASWAAAAPDSPAVAVVSRGGRPDLA